MITLLDFSAEGSSWASPWSIHEGVPKYVRLTVREAPPVVSVEWFAGGGWEFADGMPASLADAPVVQSWKTVDGQVVVIRRIEGDPNRTGHVSARVLGGGRGRDARQDFGKEGTP
jgi:hypothetical protein